MAEKCDLEEIKAIREITVEQMESLGVYRAEYNELINIYSQLEDIQADQLVKSLFMQLFNVAVTVHHGISYLFNRQAL